LIHAPVCEAQTTTNLFFRNNFWVNLHQRLQAEKAGGLGVYAGLAKLAQNVATPRNRWHALIFYTTGELVRKELLKNLVREVTR
jgi:hypothetical protein